VSRLFRQKRRLVVDRARLHESVELRAVQLLALDQNRRKAVELVAVLRQYVLRALIRAGDQAVHLLVDVRGHGLGQAGRSGSGAVLGWKNLKAITVTGNQVIPLNDPAATAQAIRKWNNLILQNPLTADPVKVSSCPGCPIRCKRPEKDTSSVLDDLGIDSMDAHRHLFWLLEKHGVTPESTSENKSGQRRNKFYHSILQSMGMQNCEAVFNTYQKVAEVVSICGLCMFSIIPCLHFETENHASFSLSEQLPLLLQSSTGIPFSTEDLLEIGKENLELQDALQRRFKKKSPAV